MSATCTYQFDPDTVDGESQLSAMWDCPHETHTDADRCLFHLTPAERRERDIAPATVAAKLRRVAEREGADAKQVIGGMFTDLELNRLIIDAPDRHPLDLRHVTISGECSLEAVEFRQPLSLAGAEIDTLDFEEATLTEHCDFRGAIIANKFDATSTVFEGDVDLENVQFGGPACFEETRFFGDTCLRGTVYEKTASFDGVEFRGDANLLDDDACFEGARFHGAASFRKAKFRYADFVGVVFETEADFDEAVFTGDGEFADAAFHGAVSFRGTEFHGDANVLIDDADFSGASFADDATFEQAEFSLANFSDTTFQERAIFVDVVFEADTTFNGARFDDGVTFDEARFDDDTRFDETILDGAASFRGVEFLGGDNVEDDDVTFADAEFAGHADFTAGVFQYANFERCSFEEVTVDDCSFGDDVIFDDCSFAAKATFTEVRFQSDVSFTGVTFEEAVSFRGVEFQGGDNLEDDDVTFADAEFAGHADFTASVFQYANFEDAVFESASAFDSTAFADDAVFDRTRFGGPATFEEARFTDDCSFAATLFDAETSFRGAEFQGGDNVVTDDLTFADAEFTADVDFKRTRFRQAVFKNVEIAGTATFEEARFDRMASFSSTEFYGEVTFTEARFYDDVRFADATFGASTRFCGVEFHGGDNVREDGVNFAGVTFESDIDFEHAEFAYTTFDDATVVGNATFTAVTFTDRASFTETTFRKDATFAEATFEQDVVFAEATIDGYAEFFGVEFEGSNSEKADADFAGVTFASGVNFQRIECSMFGMSDATIIGESKFEEAQLGDVTTVKTVFGGPADFSHTLFKHQVTFADSTFEGKATLYEARFDDDACFAGVSFEGETSFEGAEFRGGANTVDDADFETATFGATVIFEKAKFRYANFAGAEFEDTTNFVDTSFDRGALFQRAEFDGPGLFSRAVFGDETNFSSTVFGAKAFFDEVQFKDDTTFADAVFEDDTVFIAAEFKGSANHHEDDATFESATFTDLADFERATFQHANFVRTAFGDRGSFSGVVFENSVEFQPQPVDGNETLVELGGAHLSAGSLGQPESGRVYYDLTGAEIAAVRLEHDHCEGALFDYFRFCDTSFDGFDFTTHKAHLAESNWTIHEFIGTHLLKDGALSLSNPANLENTYLKAKNAAAEFGERKAAAEFFIKEMVFRGKKNWLIATGHTVGSATDTSPGTRLKAFGKWGANRVLHQTCGYGERLWRVMYVSVVAILFWAMLYTVIPGGLEDTGTARGLESVKQLMTPAGVDIFSQNVYFSAATFITLEYVGTSPAGSLARWLASLEAYTGALLIAMFVFVLGRRVAW